MKVQDAISRLKDLYQTPTLGPNNTLTPEVPIQKIIALSKYIGQNHELALQIWTYDVAGAKSLAILIDVPKKVTEKQMDQWINEIHSREVCDLACTTLFDKTEFCSKKILEWAKSDEEFIKRAAFVLIASTATNNKDEKDSKFLEYLSLIEKYSSDERNFVKKSLSWALKKIGKRNQLLYSQAFMLAQKLSSSKLDSARWIGLDSLKELEKR